MIEIFPGMVVPVARLYHLITLKALARDDRNRPQDALDLRQLVMAAQQPDLEAACAAARLIEARGFNRSRHLTGAILSTWREFRP